MVWYGINSPVAPQLFPAIGQFGGAPQVVPQAVPPTVVAPPPVVCLFEPLKLLALKDLKAFLDNFKLIQYYLQVLEYLTGQSDDALITDSSNLEASCMWEGQLCIAIKDGSLCFLFKNKGYLYNGSGFEILAALSRHCCPDTVVNAFNFF